MTNVCSANKYVVAESWASGKDAVREKAGIQCSIRKNLESHAQQLELYAVGQ